ncbi:MAG: hypothetical protein M1825_004419 [Sarcosagium campestre]|nr:MAG: hypothetical protein M1825_004419 [Sarcosagium campestre]
MAQRKRRKVVHTSHARTTQPATSKKKRQEKSQSSQRTPQHLKRSSIPFEKDAQILLIGEGDFSFAASLHTSHACINLTATTLLTHEGAVSQHPLAAQHIATLERGDQRVLYEVDAVRLDRRREVRLGRGKWDCIAWNFPHTGGKSTDVNRQVRANQELLVGFFKAALPLLAPQGTVVVTLFVGEPYELWNVRDLARHAGLRVGRSFDFNPALYPGYAHVRTSGKDPAGAWKADERRARSFVFEVEGPRDKEVKAGKRKRGRDHADDDDDDDDYD